MKYSIFGRFTQYKKWKDYISFKSFECYGSLILTLLLFFLSFYVDIYKNFDDFLSAFQSLTIYLFQALIGMLGIILAGLAIIISMFNKEIVQNIEQKEKGKLNSILVSFEFLAFNIGLGVFLNLGLYLILFTKEELISYPIFIITFILITYFISFIVLYTISLISNCVRIFNITSLYNEINHIRKPVVERANEIRIDYLIYVLAQETQLSKEDLLNDLNRFIDDSSDTNKEELKEYFKKYYQ